MDRQDDTSQPSGSGPADLGVPPVILTPAEQRREIERQTRMLAAVRRGAEREARGLAPVPSRSERVVSAAAQGIALLIVGVVAIVVVAVAVTVGSSVLDSLSHLPSGGGGPAETACEAAFRDAADGSVAGNSAYDLDPAMRACGSMSEWSAAFRRDPAPGAGNDPRFVAENRCMAGGFSDTAICRELGITP